MTAGSEGAGGSEKAGGYVRNARPAARAPIPIRRWLLLLLVGVAVYALGFSPRGFLALRRLRLETRAAVQERTALLAESARLTEARERLESGAAIEETAREMYGFARRGEEIYVLPVPTEPAPLAALPATADSLQDAIKPGSPPAASPSPRRPDQR